MKKALIEIVLICLVLMIPMIVIADMGAPEIKKFKASPRNVEGAPYYEWKMVDGDGAYVNVGTINYDDVVEIMYETEQDGIIYGYLDGESHNYYVILEDMQVIDDEETETTHSENKIELIAISEELPIYQGPNHAYDKIGMIPGGKHFTGYRQTKADSLGFYYEETMIPWFYTEYEGISGWVCELNNAIGNFHDEEIIMMVDLTSDERRNNHSSLYRNKRILYDGPLGR